MCYDPKLNKCLGKHLYYIQLFLETFLSDYWKTVSLYLLSWYRVPFPSTHTTLFWRPYDVVLTSWTFYGRQSDVVCLLGYGSFYLV